MGLKLSQQIALTESKSPFKKMEDLVFILTVVKDHTKDSQDYTVISRLVKEMWGIVRLEQSISVTDFVGKKKYLLLGLIEDTQDSYLKSVLENVLNNNSDKGLVK
ncbi:hypothetical protein COF68_04940 [Bacillus toyonensis]|uniref:hypothetical protein n=1 Tax=Bacillus toyonensis TaxID=155322 RepID=UPI000BFD72E3|nr:hypothetical protein [Bacillus toyonensis]PHE64194.1 hypothetical protein COF68_04940 [Bacillus toyonensis]